MPDSQAQGSDEICFRVPSQLSTSSLVSAGNQLTSFKSTSTAIYKKHSPGLWQPYHSTIFLIMMSTFCHSETDSLGGACVPLAHCSSLDYAHQNLAALARHCGVDTKVLDDPSWSHSFAVKGAVRSRSFWIKEVEHTMSLKMMDFDEIDGGLGDKWVMDQEEYPYAYDLTSTFLADAYWGSTSVDDSATEVEEEFPSANEFAGTVSADAAEDAGRIEVESAADDDNEASGQNKHSVDTEVADALEVTVIVNDDSEKDAQARGVETIELNTVYSSPSQTVGGRSVHFDIQA